MFTACPQHHIEGSGPWTQVLWRYLCIREHHTYSLQGILKSAANEPSVKRFVYTSSSTAATLPIPNKEFTIDTDTWNDAIIKKAWAPPPYRKDRVLAVYGSSKTEGEKALWKFMEEQKPAFVANAILPNVNFGTILAKAQPTSSGMWIKILYDGNTDYLEEIPPRMGCLN